eukprot:TRINITY_DN8647_c0_g1_i3.p3 TRINITY_DN8647_c0_g1~~TRINITY_DN8647_c0_g1_i3.p3  ORF type:complete len:215 (-),score=60.74 TRINITY_DN8647_c0_g1_i3:879-1523(-)
MEDFELLESFVSESNDLIDDVEPLFIQLEKTAGSDQHVDVDVVNKIFRLFHSMKGSAGFIGLNNIAKVTHHAETLLDAFRKNPELPMTAYFLEVQLQAIDAIRTMLENTMNNGNDEGLEDLRDTVVDRLVEALEVAEGGAPPEETSPKTKDAAKSEKKAKKAPAESKKTNKQEDLERENIRKMIESEGGSNFFHDGSELLEKNRRMPAPISESR